MFPNGPMKLRLQHLQATNSRLQKSNRQLEKLNQQLSRANEPLIAANEHLQVALGQLQIGVVIGTADGRVTFLSQTARQFLGPHQSGTDQTWDSLFPFEEKDKERLREACRSPLSERTGISVRWHAANGGYYGAQIEIRDDPRDADNRIFLLNNISKVVEFRSALPDAFCGVSTAMPLICREVQGFCGQSKAMQQVCREIQDLSTVDATVLIEGETGTGKELVARAIHHSGIRQHKPFLAINCSGLTESLLTSQLFGHKRGSFTGAIADQVGFFEAAHGGTLFLDEIGDMPLSLQSSLLRVLQEREITRIGETRPRKIDVRIIAATHRDLSAEVARETFRQDLFYRLRVAKIQLLPLREHPEDIPLLVARFCREQAKSPMVHISPEALGMLTNYPWPGNVRELKSVIESAVIHLTGPAIYPGDLPPEIRNISSPVRGRHQPDEMRVLDALGKVHGNRTAAARLLGVSRATLYRVLSSLDAGAKEPHQRRR